MKRMILTGVFAISILITWVVAADSKSNARRPPVVVFYGLGNSSPQTAEQFDEAARKYIASKKLSFNLEGAAQVEVNISNTNAPVWVRYTDGLAYLAVQFDRDGNALRYINRMTHIR